MRNMEFIGRTLALLYPTFAEKVDLISFALQTLILLLRLLFSL